MVLPNGGAEGIPSRDPLRPKTMPSQILSEFHFSVDRGKEKSGKESRNLTRKEFEDSIFFLAQNRIHRSSSAVLYYVGRSAFGRISLMRDDGGDKRDDEESGGGRERKGEIKTRSIKSRWNE